MDAYEAFKLMVWGPKHLHCRRKPILPFTSAFVVFLFKKCIPGCGDGLGYATCRHVVVSLCLCSQAPYTMPILQAVVDVFHIINALLQMLYSALTDSSKSVVDVQRRLEFVQVYPVPDKFDLLKEGPPDDVNKLLEVLSLRNVQLFAFHTLLLNTGFISKSERL